MARHTHATMMFPSNRLVILALGLTAACAIVHRPPATVASIAADASGIHAVERSTIDTVVSRLVRRAITRGDHRLDILLLSGGGQNGAYGAGFLRGWRSLGPQAMPQFDLVTGISTGALQAPFAFLGTAPALDTLSALYRRGADRIAPTIDPLFWLLHTGGVLNVGRYRQTIEVVYDEQMSAALRCLFDGDRQLVVATTDFDLGITRTWDVDRELTKGGPLRLDSLLLAATAVPTLFPAVMIDGHLHADGGVISNLLPVLGLHDYRALASQLAGAGVTQPVVVHVWVVMNVLTAPVPVVVDPASRSAIGARMETLLFTGQQLQLLDRLETLARAVSSDVPGLRMELHATMIPQSLASDPGSDTLFDRDWMIGLEQVGFERARGNQPWDRVSPRR
jgi:predicted acylesterase/phospholipase RssA